MPFDGLTIRALCAELNSDLQDARVDKIHQPEKDEIVLSLRSRNGSFRLLLSANPRWSRLHLSSYKKENPKAPPVFCMLLRKYLEGGKIKNIRQVDFERIVYIDIEAMDDFREWKSKRLICEFTGRHSNIILVNPDTNIIIDAMKKFGSELNSYREVLPGKIYVAPPDQGKLNPLKSSMDEFVQSMWSQSADKSLAAALFSVYSGISPFSSRQLCLQSDLDPELPVEQCGEYEFTRLHDRLAKLLAQLSQGKSEAHVLLSDSQPLDYAPYHFWGVSPDHHTSSFDNINEACDAFFSRKMEQLHLDSMKANLNRTLKSYLDKAYKKRFLQEGDLATAHINEKYRVWGELLTSYAHQFKKGDTEVELADFYSGENIKIQLDPRYTPIQNAQRYFKIYNKSRAALKHLAGLMAQNQEEIDYLESVMLSVNQTETTMHIEEIVEELEQESYLKEHARRKPKGEKTKPRRFISGDGLEIMVGRNNRQNDLLSLKQAAPQDLWLHARQIPGTHVIIKLPKNITRIDQVPDKTLEQAAVLAAHFSKAGQSSKVEVDYTFRANVRKPPGAKPGMVIYDDYWTIIINPQDKDLLEILAESNRKND